MCVLYSTQNIVIQFDVRQKSNREYFIISLRYCKIQLKNSWKLYMQNLQECLSWFLFFENYNTMCCAIQMGRLSKPWILFGGIHIYFCIHCIRCNFKRTNYSWYDRNRRLSFGIIFQQHTQDFLYIVLPCLFVGDRFESFAFELKQVDTWYSPQNVVEIPLIVISYFERFLIRLVILRVQFQFYVQLKVVVFGGIVDVFTI
eukprot:TRINITY_DN4792_c0_g1_i3.p2 TRINITY_DN4792_c0_g1~~TRINITY_DN4792_c0_g1_i3.p2  ORF type:complete len:201 (-),score=-5.60 TRINITY_DN4792_c0_g1_i3:657-1259(-)